MCLASSLAKLSSARTRQSSPGLVQYERQEEFLHDAEHAEIFVRRDLVQDLLLVGAEAGSRRRAGEALRHHVAAEIQLLVFTKDVVELPLRAERRGERRFEIEIVVHPVSPFLFDLGRQNRRQDSCRDRAETGYKGEEQHD